MKTCPKCGTQNDDLFARCARCNARLPRITDEAHAPEGATVGDPIRPNVGLAVLATILFVPFGVLSLIQAGQVKGWYQVGQIDRAEAAAAGTKRWAYMGIVVGLIVNAALVIAMRLA